MDGCTDRQKAMHMSPPCTSTGALNEPFHPGAELGLYGGYAPRRVCTASEVQSESELKVIGWVQN